MGRACWTLLTYPIAILYKQNLSGGDREIQQLCSCREAASVSYSMIEKQLEVQEVWV